MAAVRLTPRKFVDNKEMPKVLSICIHKKRKIFVGQCKNVIWNVCKKECNKYSNCLKKIVKLSQKQQSINIIVDI